jgi:predicted nucleic acid-binding protein
VARARRRARAATSLTDLLVLDAEGVSKAAADDRAAQAWLERARELDAEVIVSAVTVAEVVRGVARDGGCDRVLKAADIWPVDESLGRRAGRLLASANFDATIDALVAATAVTAIERYEAPRCVVLTSDPNDLAALLADEPRVRVVPV